MSLAHDTSKGAIWQILGGGGQTIVRILSSMVLARNLNPEDFGIFGLSVVVYGVFELLTVSGMTTGIIAKKEVDDEDLSTCFWCIVFIRISLFSFLFLSASIISYIMGEPELTKLLRVVSFLILISGIGSLSQSLLVKKMQFKEIVTIKFFGMLVESVTAVVLVLYTSLGYWCLVLSMLSGVLIINVLFIYCASWLPKLTFSYDRMKYLLRYGFNSMGSSVTSYLGNNFDYMIVGKMLGTQMLGYYEFAYRVPHIINERVSGPVSSVVFSALSKIKGDDEFLKAYLSATKYIALISFPAFAGLALLSNEIIIFLWGDKWLLINIPLKILCVSACINSISEISKYSFICQDRPDIPFKFDLLSLFATVILVSIGGYFFGLVGVSVGMVMSKLISVVSSLLSIKMLNKNPLCLFRSLIVPALLTFMMVVCVYFSKAILLESLSFNFGVVLLSVGIGVFSYVLLMYFFAKEELNIMLSHIFKKGV